MVSPSIRRATKRRRSSIAELAFHGIHTSRACLFHRVSVTSWELELAEADLDVVIRAAAKQQNKSLMQAARKRHDRFIGLAAKAKDKAAKARYKQTAKDTLLYASVAARRLHVTADNAADSYARSMKKAAEQTPAKKAAKKKS
jgi:hypothetical protein